MSSPSAPRIMSSLLMGLMLLGGWSCGSTVPVWGPEADAPAADAHEVDAPPITDVEALAAALKADPRIELGPHPTGALDAPGLEPGRVVELPADGPAADPEVLHAWLVSAGVLVGQIEYLMPRSAPEAPAFAGEGDPGLLRMRFWVRKRADVGSK